jgi:hypothetical protein
MPSFWGNIVDGRIALNVLVGPVQPAPATDSPTKDEPSGNGHAPLEPKAFRAIVDTGAVISGISSKVVAELELEAREWTLVSSVNGPSTAPLYRVSLAIPISEGSHGFA